MDGHFNVVVLFVPTAERLIISRIRVNAILKQGGDGLK
jgi:hypothetical protein